MFNTYTVINGIPHENSNRSNHTTTSVFCEEDTTYSGEKKLTWGRTQIGSSTYPNEFCLDDDGYMLQRNCYGDYNSHPGRWAEVTGNCSESYETSNVTDFVHRLLGQYIVNGSWNYEELAKISYRISEFTCIDLFLVSKALYYMTVEEYMYNLFDHFERTLDNTLEAFGLLNEGCRKFNASSYILGAVNVFFNRVTEEPNDLKEFVRKNFIFQISNPFEEGITGLALYKNELDDFRNYTIKKIYNNESYSDISTQNLELASYVPADLIERLSSSLSQEEKNKFKIIIVAFRNHTLFDLGEDKEVISKVIGISISGFCSHAKTNLFDIYSKPLISGEETETEGDGEETETEGESPNNDDIYSEDIITECNFPPVTYMFLYGDETDIKECQRDVYPYAELSVKETESTLLKFPTLYRDFDILSSLSISINYAQPQTVIESIYKRHNIVLKTIMIIGCALSLFSLAATTLTLISIKNWYKKRMYTIQLEIAMGFETFLFLIDSDISYITYIILYYFILSQFSWMMLVGSLVIGWVIPAIVIVIPIVLHPECLYCEYCPAKRSILIYFVIIPTSLIILINITIYLLVMISISRSKSQDFGANIGKKRTRIGLLLPFMLGITWIFVFALVSPWRWFSLAGSYLFHLIAPAQGFVLFIFVVVLDKDTRTIWQNRFSTVKDKLSYVKKDKTKSTVSTVATA
ncbi:7 transmembrane receptor (Secretin family) [Popillia japonica]